MYSVIFQYKIFMERHKESSDMMCEASASDNAIIKQLKDQLEKEKNENKEGRREKESLLQEKSNLLKLVEILQFKIPDCVFYDAYFGRKEEVKSFLRENRQISINSICQCDDIKISGKSLAFIACQNNDNELLNFLTQNYLELDFLNECVIKDIDLFQYRI